MVNMRQLDDVISMEFQQGGLKRAFVKSFEKVIPDRPRKGHSFV